MLVINLTVVILAESVVTIEDPRSQTLPKDSRT